MNREYIEYIEQVLSAIKADPITKERIKQSLTEHIDVLIEKHGSLAYKYLEPPAEVAKEFTENLGLKREQEEFNRPWWLKQHRFYRKISKKKVFNLPLYHITDGFNPETNKFEVAKAIFAVGPVALGIFAWGGISIGIFSFGGIGLALLLSLGGFAISLGAALGGMAFGGLLAMGGLAVSFGLAFGGMAIGHVAIGGSVTGKYFYDTNLKEGNAVEWFQVYLPYFVKYFN